MVPGHQIPGLGSIGRDWYPRYGEQEFRSTPVRCPRQNPASADVSSYKWSHFTDSVAAVACPPLAGFLASPEFPVLRFIISSLDLSTLSSPREPRFRLDSRAPHESFRLLPDPRSSHSPLRRIVDLGRRPGDAAVRSMPARRRPDGLRVSRRRFICGSVATTRSTDRLRLRGDDSLDGSLLVPWRRLARRIARGDGR